MEELTAQFCEKMFSMEESMQPVLADVQQNHKGLWAKIKEFFQGFIEKVRKLIEAGETAQKSEALQAWESISEEMQKVFAAKWGEALRSAKQTHDAVTGLEAAGIQVEGIKNTAQEGGEEQYQIRHTTTNKPVVVISDDILQGVPEDQWIETVTNAMKQFKDGIPISGRLIKVNYITRHEYTHSKDTKNLEKANKPVYEDKMRAGNHVDEIVLASTDYVNEALNHARNDNFEEFARGDVLMRIGGNDYSANVIVGFTTGRSMVLYDVVDLTPTNEIKNAGLSSPSRANSYAQNSSNKPAVTNIAQPSEKSNTENNNSSNQTRPTDTVSDVELLLQQKVEDATNREQGRLLKEFQAKARQVWESISEEMQKFFAAKWGEALRSAKQTHDAFTGLEAQGIRVESEKNTADPVTYDDSGNVIPLSERFNTENEDVRYQSRPIKDADDTHDITWARNHNEIKRGDFKRFYTAIADIKKNGYNSHVRTKYGEYVIENGGVIMFASDDFDNPTMTRAIVLHDSDETNMTEAKEWILDEVQRTGRYDESARAISLFYGEGYASFFTNEILREVRGENERREGEDRRVYPREAEGEPVDYSFQNRPTDAVSDVEVLEQLDETKAVNREQGRLLKEAQAQAKTIKELETKLEKAKADLKRTDRSCNTRGIQKLIGDTMKTFGMGDAKNVGIRKTAAEMLNKAYDKAIAAIDRGDSAGALDEVYQGAVSVAEYLLDGRNMISRKRRLYTMKTPLFRGTCTALVTPFRDFEIDYPSLDRLLDTQLEAGVEALVICGTTGEAATLEFEETLALIAHCVRYCGGRTKLIAGTGGNNTRKAAKTAREAAALGVDGLLCVTPYYNRCTQAGLIAHYEAIAAATELPIILYNVPSRTNVDIAPETCAELAKLPTVNGIKEANPDVGRVLKLRRLCGFDFPIYCGNDDRILPFMACGALGVVSVLSNLRPKQVKELTDACLRGEFARALTLQQDQQPMIEALFSQVNPIPMKAALNLCGQSVGDCRLPLTPPTEDLLDRLKTVL